MQRIRRESRLFYQIMHGYDSMYHENQSLADFCHVAGKPRDITAVGLGRWGKLGCTVMMVGSMTLNLSGEGPVGPLNCPL